MPQPSLSHDAMWQALEALEHHGTVTEAARALGLPRNTFNSRLNRARLAGLDIAKPSPEPSRPFIVPELPSPDETIDELLARRIRESERVRRAAAAREIIPVDIKTAGPIGLMIVGDPHVDDPGSDFASLYEHLTIAHKRQPYLFACGIGDLQNAWPGRLAKLYAHSNVSIGNAWKTVEWMMRYVPWLFLVKGNHDCFVGDSDPLDWIMRDSGAAYQAHGVRLALQHPNGAVTRIHARHDFKGHSMYNGLHGHMRELREGFRDHLLVAGHRHFGEEAAIVNPEGAVSQLVRVSGYKIVDDYAEAHGYKAKPIHKSALVLIDPEKPDSNRERIWLAPSVEEGAEYLDWRRARYEGRARVTVRA